jgi:hypothetical protein
LCEALTHFFSGSCTQSPCLKRAILLQPRQRLASASGTCIGLGHIDVAGERFAVLDRVVAERVVAGSANDELAA